MSSVATFELNKTVGNREALKKYYLATKRIVSKKEGAVPVLQWWGTFAIFNHLTGSAIRYALKVYPEGVEKPQFLGAVLRFVINRVVLKRVREYLAKNPGVEKPEEVAKIIAKYVEEILANEEELARKLRDELVRLGIPEEEMPKYLEALKITLPKVKEYIETEGPKILAKIFGVAK